MTTTRLTAAFHRVYRSPLQPPRPPIAEEARDVIQRELDVARERLTDDARLKEDLAADSLDRLELTMELEKAFEIDIPDEDAQRIHTVGDVVAYLERHLPLCSPPVTRSPMPELTAEQQKELEKRFTHHPPKGNQADRYAVLRSLGRTLAEDIVTSTPASREQSLALTHVQEAVMWANAAIACNE